MEEQDQKKFLLAIALSTLVLGISMFFQTPPVVESTGSESSEATLATDGVETDRIGELADAGIASPWSATGSSTLARVIEPVVAPIEEERHRIEMPLYEVEFSTRGGAIASWWLLEYRSLDGVPIELTMTERGINALATPLTDLGLGDLSNIPYEFKDLGDGRVSFSAEQGDYLIRKIYQLDPNNYVVDMEIEVHNNSTSDLQTEIAVYWPSELRTENDFAQYELIAFQGDKKIHEPMQGAGKASFFGKIFGDDEEDPDHFRGGVAWAGAQSRYFLAAVFPEDPRTGNARFIAEPDGKGAITEISSEVGELGAGRVLTRSFRSYIGPKEPERLAAMGSELTRTTDMGWSLIRPLVRGFRWGLLSLSAIFGNLGVSIIVITILLKVVMAPLTQGQMKSMRRMGELKPQIEALKKKYGDDRQAMGQAQMELFKKEGVNPLGGCLPMVLQMPVFIGLYFALQSTIELRHAPFFGWITDLSAPEILFIIPIVDFPFRLMPLIMGVSMVVQQKLTPTPSMDPAQAKMMTIFMPLMMTVMFYQFPSGLVLYWLMNNLLTIAHTAWMHRDRTAAA